MFWVVDNFLMRKHRKMTAPQSEEALPVLYVNSKKRGERSDEDEATIRLMDEESRESLIDDPSGSDYDSLHRRINSDG